MNLKLLEYLHFVNPTHSKPVEVASVLESPLKKNEFENDV
jgi:hypothetical protein